jgi:hypothetical protein
MLDGPQVEWGFGLEQIIHNYQALEEYLSTLTVAQRKKVKTSMARAMAGDRDRKCGNGTVTGNAVPDRYRSSGGTVTGVQEAPLPEFGTDRDRNSGKNPLRQSAKTSVTAAATARPLPLWLFSDFEKYKGKHLRLDKGGKQEQELLAAIAGEGAPARLGPLGDPYHELFVRLCWLDFLREVPEPYDEKQIYVARVFLDGLSTRLQLLDNDSLRIKLRDAACDDFDEWRRGIREAHENFILNKPGEDA